MSASPVDRLAAALADRYRLERELGAGGMATVYLAADLKHDRQVAIKVLKPDLAAVLGAERFVQEIKTTAALAHPHILPLFDSGSVYGPDRSGPYLFYVMPFIEGETIRDRLNRETQFGVDEAVRIAREVADALDYAHRHGVIHRDIKPENILLHDGRAMVMDFGIALAVSAAAGGRMTETGLSLGTPHYMSPEQATADKDLTPRSDIYSLASVLYEMLAGEPPHTGGSAQQVIMKIVTEEAVPVTRRRKSVPEPVAEALAQALEKLPADRFGTAREFASALAGEGSPLTPRRARTTVSPAASRPAFRSALPVLLALALLAALAAWGWLRPGPPAGTPIRLSVELPDSVQAQGARLLALPSVGLSDDGTLLALVGSMPRTEGGRTRLSQLFVRRLSDPALSALEGTEQASSPVFSPDGEWIAFLGQDRSLRRVPVVGGAVQVLVDSAGAFDWGDDGSIYFIRHTGIWAWGVEGAGPQLIVAVDSTAFNFGAGFLEVLPGSRMALVGVLGSDGNGSLTTADLRAGTLGTDRLLGTTARFVPPGWLLFESAEGVLSAIRFSPRTGRTEGAAIRVAEPVERLASNRGLDFAVAANGTLAIRWSRETALGPSRLVQIDARGVSRILREDGRRYDQPRLSPDGRHLLVRLGASVYNTGDLWIIELASGAMTRLTSGDNSYRASWSRDGARVFHLTGTASTSRVISRPWDGSGGDSVVIDRRDIAEFAEGLAGGWSILRSYTQRDIFLVPTDSLATPHVRPFTNTPSNETDVALSPSGRLLAYQSDETGEVEVYLRPVPGPGPRVPVSVAGGSHPTWSRDERTLYYLDGTVLMAATIAERPALAVIRRDSLFPAEILQDGQNVVALPSGAGFIAAVGAQRRAAVPYRIDIITNWQSLFEPARERR